MKPKISVITVVYNGEKYLEKAIKSVLDQTYSLIEYIIIDGQSTDRTIEIIRKYENNIAKWITEKDNGIYDAMNKGLEYATGDVIGILNADDWYEPDAIEKVANAFDSDPEAQIVHGLLCFRDEHENLQYITGHTVDFLNKGMEHPATFVKREVYMKYGSFNTSFKAAGDYELMLRFRTQGLKFAFIKEILANFRAGGQSTSLLAAVETVNLNYQYRFISGFKRLILLIYWRFKTLL